MSPFEKIPFLRGFSIKVRRRIPEVKEVLRSHIASLFVLERGREEVVEELEAEEAFRRLLLSTDMAFNPFSHQIILGYAYADPSLDLVALREKHLKLLMELVGRAYCLRLKSPEPGGFVRLASRLVS